VQSLYAMVNNRGVAQFTHRLCGSSLFLPGFIYFLWLFTNNKIITRDNLAKRKKVDDMTCLFCNEQESFVF
jgi:hypothetical protein